MIPISNAFRAELQQQIRRPGHAIIIFRYNSGGIYQVPEYSIQSIDIRSKADPLSRQLPIEECTIVLNDFEGVWDPANPNGYYANTVMGISIYVEFGIETSDGVEWSELVSYETDGNLTHGNNSVQFHAVRALPDGTCFGLGGEQNLFVAADDIMSSGHPREIPPAWIDDYYLCEKLQESPLINHTNLKNKTQKDALLSIAFAGRCALRVRYDGVPELRDYWLDEPEYNPAPISKNDFMTLPVVEQLPLLAYERVNYYEDPTAEERKTVLEQSGGFDVDESVDDTAIVWFSSDIKPRSLTITAMSNINQQTFSYYAWRSGIEIYNLERLDHDQPWSITATGIVQNPVKKTILERVAGRLEQGGPEIEEIDNPLLNAETEYAVAMFRGRFLRRTRTSYKFQYRGDPSIEALDKIVVDLPHYGKSLCIVSDCSFQFQAGFSGTLTVRRIEKNNQSDYDIWSGVSDYAVSDFAISDEDQSEE